jgi:hypothetical protein
VAQKLKPTHLDPSFFLLDLHVVQQVEALSPPTYSLTVSAINGTIFFFFKR